MTPHSTQLAGLVFSQIWQVTLVAAVAGTAAALLCRSRPRLAYLLGLVVLAKCWAPPLWSSPVGVFCRPSPATEETRPARAKKSAQPQTAVERPTAEIELADDDAPDVVDTAAAGLRYDEPRRSSFQVTWPVLLGCVWLWGAITLAALASYQGRRWRKGLGRLKVPHDGVLDSLAAELASRLGLRRAPRVVISSAAVGPAVFGLLRPTVVVPASLVGKGVEDRLQMVLAHEMIHIRRGDLLAGVFQWVTQIVWWFHPLIWLTCRELARERERCCDEEVLASLRCPAVSYAQCLLDVLRLNRGTPLLPAFPGMRAVEVTRQRFEHILRFPVHAGARTPRRYWLLAAILLCIVLPGAPQTIATPSEEERASPRATSVRDAAQSAAPVEHDASYSAPGPVSNKNPASERLALADDGPPPERAAANAADVEPPPERRQAIDRGVSFLKLEQRADGSWPDPVGYPGGITAICTLALVRSGVKPHEQSVQSAVDFLRQVTPARTYNAALQTMVFCAVNPRLDRKRIERNVEWLCAGQKLVGPMTGAWAYPEAEGDNSNTAFAMAALYEAEQVGVRAPAAVWRRAVDHWVGTQNPNGSWGYKPETGGTGSMTAQGLFCVAAATKVLELDEQPADERAAEAVEKAAQWLGRNFDAHSNPGLRGTTVWLLYYLRAVSEAGRATERQQFGDHDWFLEGMLTLLAQQRPDGSWTGTGHAEDDPHLATSLALLFLARGEEKAQKESQ